MNLCDRQIGRLNLVLTNAAGRSAIEQEDRAIWEMLDATIAQEEASSPERVPNDAASQLKGSPQIGGVSQ
jgi:hypothetical protein